MTTSQVATMYISDHIVYMALRHKHLQATIDHALDAVLAERAIVDAHHKARGVGGMIDAFEEVGRRRARTSFGT